MAGVAIVAGVAGCGATGPAKGPRVAIEGSHAFDESNSSVSVQPWGWHPLGTRCAEKQIGGAAWLFATGTAGAVAWTNTDDRFGGAVAHASGLAVADVGALAYARTPENAWLVTMLAPSGTPKWTRIIEHMPVGTGSVAVLPDGGVAAVVAGDAGGWWHQEWGIVRFDANGAVLWRWRFAGTSGVAIAGCPEGSLYVVANREGEGVGLHRYGRTGKQLWRLDGNGTIGAPALSGHIAANQDGAYWGYPVSDVGPKLSAVSAEDGRVRWTVALSERKRSWVRDVAVLPSGDIWTLVDENAGPDDCLNRAKGQCIRHCLMLRRFDLTGRLLQSGWLSNDCTASGRFYPQAGRLMVVTPARDARCTERVPGYAAYSIEPR